MLDLAVAEKGLKEIARAGTGCLLYDCLLVSTKDNKTQKVMLL